MILLKRTCNFQIGTQYEIEIFYENDEQKDLAIKIKDKFNKIFNNKIETIFPQLKTIAKQRNIIKNTLKKSKMNPLKTTDWLTEYK